MAADLRQTPSATSPTPPPPEIPSRRRDGRDPASADRTADDARLWRGALDALSGHVAVLDAHGTILAVNAAWRAFAAANGGTDHIGRDYLQTCDLADDPAAAKLADGIRLLLAGGSEPVEVDYPCHSPTQERWFVARATAHAGMGPAAVVVEHRDVTAGQRMALDRLRVERELGSARDHLRAVTDHMGEGLCTLDTAGRLTHLNPTAHLLLRTGGSDVSGVVLSDLLTAGGSVDTHPLGDLATASAGGTIRCDDALLQGVDGSQTAVAVSATPLLDDAGTSWIVVLTDISRRKARAAWQEKAHEVGSWLPRLQDALREDRMVLHAQPIVDILTGAVVQHELLLRMEDPDEGLILPGRFIPAAERLGYMPTIDRWVIDRGLALAAGGMAVELNLCGGSLADPGLLPHVRAALARTGADPSTVIVEVTETDLVRNLEQAHHVLASLRDLGFRIALDDFGTGYAGFTYLKSLPVDHLKIDREFVHDLASNEASRHVIRAVVHLARALGIQTIAEGVEDEATLDCLRDLRVDHVQGYLLGRPAPIEGGGGRGA